MCLVRDHLAVGEVQSCHVSWTAPEPLRDQLTYFGSAKDADSTLERMGQFA